MASDVLVSARIAPSKKDAAKSVLASLGATTTDLINSAVDYVLEKKELPSVAAPARLTPAEFAHFLETSTLSVDWGNDAPDGNYRNLLRQGKEADYESLA